jgi:hypothetical protein
MKGPRCAICERVIPAAEAEGHFCRGCDSYICDRHCGDPWGDHEPEAHDEDEEE